MFRNHYEILGVDVEAIPSEIQAAYENLGGSNASGEVKEAYRILSDKSLRCAYNANVSLSDYQTMQTRFHQCAHYHVEAYNKYLKLYQSNLSQYAIYISMRNFVDINTNNVAFKERERKLKTEKAKNLHIKFQKFELEINSRLAQLNIPVTDEKLKPVALHDIIKLSHDDVKKLDEMAFDDYKHAGKYSFIVEYNSECMPFYERIREFYKITHKNTQIIIQMYDSFKEIDEYSNSIFFSDWRLIKAMEVYIEITKKAFHAPFISTFIEYTVKIHAFYMEWYGSIERTDKYKLKSHVEHHFNFMKNVKMLKEGISKQIAFHPELAKLDQVMIESVNFISTLKDYLPADMLTKARQFVQLAKPVVANPPQPEYKPETIVPVEAAIKIDTTSDLYKLLTNSINHLNSYIQRVESHKYNGNIDFKHGFTFFKTMRARSRQANYQLAVNVRDQILGYKQSYESGYTLAFNENMQQLTNPVSLKALRQSLWHQPGKINRTIKSKQLNDVLEFIGNAARS